MLPSGLCASHQGALNPAVCVFIAAQPLLQWPLMAPRWQSPTSCVQEIQQLWCQNGREQRLKA